MNDLLIRGIALLNKIFTVSAGNFIGLTMECCGYWIALLLISGLTGLFFIPVFKHFSNQRAIIRVRDRMGADILSVRIFRDNPRVMARAQGRVLLGSLQLVRYTLPALLIMIVPISFLLTQMSGWYQFRPLKIGETAIITLALPEDLKDYPSAVILETPESVESLTGPVFVESRSEMVWKIAARENGLFRLNFENAGNRTDKQLSVGQTSLPVSIKKPGGNIMDILLNPFEQPSGGNAFYDSISLSYGDPVSDPIYRYDWLAVFCAFSIVVFLIFKRFFKVVI